MNAYDQKVESENKYVKSRGEIFTAGTRKAGESFNRRMAAIDQERASQAGELAAIEGETANPESGETGGDLCNRIHTLRGRTLETDIAELRILQEFPGVRRPFYAEAMGEAKRLETESEKVRDKLKRQLLKAGFSEGLTMDKQIHFNSEYRAVCQAGGLWESRAKPFGELFNVEGMPHGPTAERFMNRTAELQGRIRKAIIGDLTEIDQSETQKIKLEL